MPNLKVAPNVESKAGAGFVGATELANMLVRRYNVAFRTSHKIVGALVKTLIESKQTLMDATPELLQKVAQQAIGIKLIVKKQDMVECTNPRKIIETYKVQGGPSPVEVERAIKTLKKNMISSKNNISELKHNLANSQSRLNSIVESYSLSDSSSNVRLKNPNL